MELTLNRHFTADGSYGLDRLPRSPVSQTSSSAALIVAIAAGSAAGGVARFILSTVVQDRWSTSFPAGTLVVNVLGCIALGFISYLVLETGEFSPTTRALLTTGFCGGFTTFSTFAMETIRAAEEGALQRAMLYVGSSVIAGLAGIWIGAAAARQVVSILRRVA